MANNSWTAIETINETHVHIRGDCTHRIRHTSAQSEYQIHEKL